MSEPDLYLGDRSEGVVTDFDGRVRQVWILERRTDQGGRRLLRVRVEPPLPIGEGDAPVTEVFLQERHVGVDVEALAEGEHASVRLALVDRPGVAAWADVARSPDDLPSSAEQRFARALAALAAFVEREGHSDIPMDQREQGLLIGVFAHNMRHTHNAGHLRPKEQAALEALPGWHW